MGLFPGSRSGRSRHASAGDEGTGGVATGPYTADMSWLTKRWRYVLRHPWDSLWVVLTVSWIAGLQAADWGVLPSRPFYVLLIVWSVYTAVAGVYTWTKFETHVRRIRKREDVQQLPPWTDQDPRGERGSWNMRER